MAQFTKQALAEALKSMMKIKSLDKITVKDLVETCNVNRQTFYYHFQDIYDLLGWIYRSEALASIQNSRSYGTWQQGLLTIFEYVEHNKELCEGTYRSLGREHMERFLNEVLNQLVGDVVDEIAAEQPISADHRDFIVRFYSYAFAGILMEWVGQGMKTPSAVLVSNMSLIMEGNLQLAVERFKNEDFYE